MTTIKKGLVGANDLRFWDGTTASKTFTRESSAGYDMTLNAVGGVVDALMVYGAGVNYTLATINAALTAIGSEEVILVLNPGAWTITDDLTIPANVHLWPLAGAQVTVSADKTITVNSKVLAGSYRWIYGTGTTTISTYPKDQAWWGSTQRLDVTGILVSGLTASSTVRTDASKVLTSFADGIYYPEAYGAAGDGTTDDTTAIQACITAAPAGSIIHLSGKTYKITDTLTCDKALTFQGTGYTTQIKQVTASKGGIAITGSSVNVYDILFNGVGHAAYDAAEIALNIYGATYAAAISKVRVENCFFANWGHSGIYSKYLTDFSFCKNQMDGIHYEAICTLSCVDGDISGNKIDDVPGSAGTSWDAYGIILSRDSSVDSLTTDPRSARITISRNIISNIPTWHGINTHAGCDLTIAHNVILNTKSGIVVTGCNNNAGAATYAPFRVAITGNTIDSQQTDGSRSNGIVVNGAASAPTVEYAYGCAITGNTVIGHGDESNASEGGIYFYSTIGLVLTGNTCKLCSPNGIVADLENYAFNATGNTAVDVWSETTAAIGFNVKETNNIAFIISDFVAYNKDSAATERLDTASGIGVVIGNKDGNSGKLGLVGGVANNPKTLYTDAGSKLTKDLNAVT